MNAVADISDRDALLREAGDLRARRRVPDALAVLDRLQALYPRFSRLHHERGHCHVVLGDAPAAITALREAVRLNPTLPASWDILEQLHRMLGDTAQAAEAAAAWPCCGSCPPKWWRPTACTPTATLRRPRRSSGAIWARTATTSAALRLPARIRHERDALDEAEACWKSVLDRAPDYHAARLDYAVVLLQRQKPQRARQEAERLLAVEPDNREYLKQYGAACVALGDHEPVIDLYERLLAGRPSSGAEVADLRLRGWPTPRQSPGRQAEAIADYRASLAARPDNGVAWFSLANLKTYRFTDDDIERMGRG